MLEPSKGVGDYEGEVKRRQKQIEEGKGVTDWGMTAEALDISKSPLAQEGGSAPISPKEKK